MDVVGPRTAMVRGPTVWNRRKSLMGRVNR